MFEAKLKNQVGALWKIVQCSCVFTSKGGEDYEDAIEETTKSQESPRITAKEINDLIRKHLGSRGKEIEPITKRPKISPPLIREKIPEIPRNSQQKSPPSNTNVRVINEAPYPQIVIIPHKSDNANDFKLSLGDQEIGFSNRQGSLSNDNIEILKPRPTEQVQITINNLRRKEALIRASEKQSLMLENLMDAMHRKTDENSTEDTLESHMEEVLQRQNDALKELKHSVEISDPDEDFTAERLTMLEDASHRQLEVLEDLVTAVQRMDGDKGDLLISCKIY